MDIEEYEEAPLILARLFLIIRMIIDMDKGKVKLQIQNEVLVLHLWNNHHQPQPQRTFFKITDRESLTLISPYN